MQIEELFRRSFVAPLLKCLDQEQAQYVLAEMHCDICCIDECIFLPSFNV